MSTGDRQQDMASGVVLAAPTSAGGGGAAARTCLSQPCATPRKLSLTMSFLAYTDIDTLPKMARADPGGSGWCSRALRWVSEAQAKGRLRQRHRPRCACFKSAVHLQESRLEACSATRKCTGRGSHLQYRSW